jgi:protein-tyrosine phosphatase
MPAARPLVPGTFNSRDLGGRRATGGIVRTGALIRSDVPIDLGDDGRAALRHIGVRTALDLRQRVERELYPADLAGLDVRVHHVPIIGEDFDGKAATSLWYVYHTLLEHRGAYLTRAAQALSEPDALPALVFCSAGKDRTGVLVALVLAALGTPDDDIVADYVLTEQAMVGQFRAAIEARAVASGITAQEFAVHVGAPAALMRDVLAWLRARDGSAAAYLNRHGLSSVQLQALRRTLVEPLAASAA